MKFSASTLFMLTAFFAAVAWCVSVMPSEDAQLRVLASLIAIGISASLQFRGSYPLRISALSGAGFVAALEFALGIVSLWEYFHHDESFPYFEEGFFLEVFVFPIAFCAIYCPVGAAMSFVVAWALSTLLNWFTLA